MKIWRMTGALAFTVGLIVITSQTGTSRQPSTTWPSRLTERSSSCSQEDHADAVVADCGKLNALRTHLLAVEGVRNLNENARAVAAERIGAHGASMVEVVQNQQRIFNDLVRRPALDVDDGTHAARVVLEFRAIKPFEAGFAPGLLFLSGHNLALQCFYFWGILFSIRERERPTGRRRGNMEMLHQKISVCMPAEIFEKPANTGWQTA